MRPWSTCMNWWIGRCVIFEWHCGSWSYCVLWKLQKLCKDCQVGFFQWSNLSVRRSKEAVAANTENNCDVKFYTKLHESDFQRGNCFQYCITYHYSYMYIQWDKTRHHLALSIYKQQLKNYNHGLYSEGLRMMLSLMVMCYVTLPLFRWGPNSIFRRHRICSLSRIRSWSSKLMTTCPCRKDNGYSILFS